MKGRRGFWMAIVLLAAAMRLPALDVRPMHADEAVHAARMAMLLEQGRYHYDPGEYHGPTLNYLTLLPAWLRGDVRYADLDEVTLRSVPAVIGILLVAAHALLVPVVGFWPALVAALLSAVSPALVYYSRYYIHETLLIAFSFGALVAICRYLQTRRTSWAVAAGACVGLMSATKETWVIAAGCMAAALALTVAFEPRRDGAPRMPAAVHASIRDALAAVTAAVVVFILFFSSFFTNPRGIADAVLAYGTYVERAAGTGSWHVHPWYYYLGLLLYFRSDQGPLWTEAAILLLGIVGVIVALARRAEREDDRALLVFLAGYALLMVVAYSAIPYKTPWCLLGFFHGLILLAGVGAVYLAGAVPKVAARAAVVAVVCAATVHLGWQARAASVSYCADPRNPYVYAHTGTGVFEIARRVEELSLAHPQGRAMPIEIITRDNLWPLPWYLRRFSDVRWETEPVEDVPCAPVILSTPDMEAAVVRKLYEARPPGERELYMSIFDAPVDLRPAVEVRGYAAKTLWDEYRR